MVLVVTVIVIIIYNLNFEVILLVIVIYNLHVEVIVIVIYNLYVVIEYKYSNIVIITIVIYYAKFGGISNSNTCLLIFKVIVIVI